MIAMRKIPNATWSLRITRLKHTGRRTQRKFSFRVYYFLPSKLLTPALSSLSEEREKTPRFRHVHNSKKRLFISFNYQPSTFNF